MKQAKRFSRTGRAFLAGSAYPAVLLPFALLSVSSILKPDSGFHMEYVVWFFPIFMGIWNILFINIRSYLPGSLTQKYWIWGLILGVIFPVTGNIYGVPGKLWGLHFPYGLLVIPFAMVAYSSVWRYLVRMMNQLLDLDDELER